MSLDLQTTKPSLGGVGFDVRYKWTWMSCCTFHISCECMGKISKVWDVTYMPGSYSSRPQTSEVIVQDFAGPANHQAILRYVWVLIRGISGHGHVATLFTFLVDACVWSESLECIPYIGIPSIQVTYLPRRGPRSGRILKTTRPSTWNCWL